MLCQLAVNFAATMIAMVLLWMIALRLRDVSFIDAIWAWGMVALSWLSAAQAWQAGGLGTHQWVVLGLVTLWGMRLGTHLFLRWRTLGQDPRYERIIAGAMARNGWSFARTALQMVFLLQGPLLWFVSLPAQAGILANAYHPALGWALWSGAGLSLFGVIFETLGDGQLAAFRRDPANKGRVMDRGLWRYTRHPNYFGDACAWWGIWLASISAGAPIWTALCPLFLTWTLMRWSGAPMLENAMKHSRPGYADYVRRRSGFIPWFPKR